MMSKLTRKILLLLLLLLVVPGVQPASAQDLPAVPSAPDSHCRGVGPVPLNSPDFCGCTWVVFSGGIVRYRMRFSGGMPVFCRLIWWMPSVQFFLRRP